MDLVQPATWAEALTARAERPDLLPIAGGTDVMVDINFDRRRPEGLLDLTRVPETATWSVDDGVLRIGAGVTYAQVESDLADLAPGLAMASRTVGSPQIRNRGTVAGNLGSASPAGDAHPPLLAVGATVEVESVRGIRQVAADDFFVGVKRNALEPDELIRSVLVPVTGAPQQFAKIGTRNAMVIAVASFAVSLHPADRRVGTGIGSAAPTPRRAPQAEEQLAGALDWDGRGPLDPSAVRRFGELVADAADPIDDVRGSAAYRRHALAVLAARTATWAWDQHRTEVAS
ncbi:FAD binding domain-containing protein [Nocardioides iriomotensis]|uniref:Xanthine dehydrogenase family protein subunit M n=1 Tax=Nocardioides iriomotensis TaxID=715784 RepID=A0A4Q5IUN5_9ACTN|nr:FAD binding domain-containing protein [Nocardioides iriomotensis]RYU09453.1 xanthine dehydrogenase family protein subunit M [Nocardioides iriomotensis]